MNRGIWRQHGHVNRLFAEIWPPLPLGPVPSGVHVGLQVRAGRLNLDTLRREMVGPVAHTRSGAAEPGRGFF